MANPAPDASGWADIMAQIKAAASAGGPPGASTGPTATNALGGNLVNGKGPMVYWGAGPMVPQYKAKGPFINGGPPDLMDEVVNNLGGGTHHDAKVSLQGAVEDWYKWTDQERATFGQRLYKLGMVSNPTDYSQVFGQWQNAVQEASNFYTFGQKKVTPWQMVDIMANTASGGLKPTTQTDTSTSLNVPTVEDAHAATRQIFQSLMGRDPNGNELDRYASMMTAYATKHPTVSKTTKTTDAQGNSKQSRTDSGGYSAAGLQDALAQQAKQDPEYGSYQAATTYWNALQQALGGGTSALG